ncbi:MAG TPA: TonB-dependent receptor [Candidatus Acidoferrum sp.]|nr:TonB-dependent receptor [Candidatus Acidoferrum sp.]
MRKLLLVVCLTYLGFPTALLAQSNRATITGTVTDSSGAVVPGVTVNATNVGTGVVTSAVTNNDGIYSVFNLFPGTYDVEFARKGFKPLNERGIKLESTQVAELNAKLEVGTITETVTVTTEAPILDKESATFGTNMNGNVVSDLPMNIYGGRSVEDFAVAITPGYSPSSSPYWAVINGTQGFTKDFTIDGTSATAQIQGDSMEVGPSMEAVQEMQAQTSGIDVGSGITNGGVIAFNLKSGTNQFHGSAFGFGHNEFLDANTWDNGHTPDPAVPGSTSTRKPKARFWDYGASAGGPIIKNKTFVFGTFERFTQNDFTPGGFGSAAWVPTSDFLNGDFSTLLGAPLTDGSGNPYINPCTGEQVLAGQIFDPETTQTVGGQVCSMPFAGNKIDPSRFSSVAKEIIPLYQKYYAPERTGLVANDRLPQSNSPAQTPNQAVIKIDHNLRDADRLSGSWVYNHRPRTLVDSGGVWDPGSTDGGPLANSRIQMVKGSEFRASEQHIFSPTLLNVFNATYNWYWNGSVPASSGTDWPQTLGFGSTGASNFPVISFGGPVNGYQETGIGNSWQGHYVGTTLMFDDQITWTKGRHAFTFGGDFRAMEINSTLGTGALSFNFSPNQTGAPTTPYGAQVGFGFASFLLGDVNDASESTPFNLYGRRKAFSFYASDTYKVTPKLTLDYGLRWDIPLPFHEKYGHWANFDLTAISPALGIPGTLVYANSGGDSFENVYYKDFGPEVGIAYNPWRRVVFRGSYGILYAPIGTQYWNGVPYGFAPGFQGVNRVNAASDGYSPAFNWDSGYPGVFVPGTKDPNYIPWGPVNIDPRSLQLGYTHNFNAGVQYELTDTTRVEASYVGNRGRRLHDPDLAFNQPNPTAFLNLYNSGNFYDWVYDDASASAAGVAYPYAGFQGFAFQAIAPYPQVTALYSPIYYVGTPRGQSTYDSLVLEVVKKAGRGVTLDFNYTLSRSLGDVLTNFGENWWNGSFQNFYDLSQDERTLTGFDQKHVFKGYITYRLPFGEGQRLLADKGRLVNNIVGGWQISGLFLYASGNPLFFYSTTVRNDYAPWAYTWSTVYMNYNLSGYNGRRFDPSHYDPSNPTAASNLYFPATVVSDPQPGTLGKGPAAIDELRGFGTASEDASLLKYFFFGSEHRYSLSLRAEFYNLFNRHGFANPSTDPSDPRFGYVTGVTGSPRQGQFGARFEW